MLRLIEIDVYQAQRAYFTGGHLRDIDLSAPLRSAISTQHRLPSQIYYT